MEYVTLANGVKMPQLGYGVYQVTREECERCVSDALKVGYRHIDTAQSYFNEEEVGEAIKKSGIPRNELFITTKVWIEHYGYEECRKSVLESMRKLQADYIDLVLLHQPFSDYYGAWRALEELYAEGKIRAIGLSNFLPHHAENILAECTVRPAVDQIEYHPGYSQEAAVQYCKENGILVQAWSPIGRSRILKDPLVCELAAKYRVSPAQICLKFAVQRGIVPLPKSSSPERMKQNMDLFSFEMEQEDIWRLATMPQSGWSGEHPDQERVFF